MGESGLSIGLPELIQEVGFFLDYGRGVVKDHTANQLSEIMSIIQSGVRRVYYPLAVNQDMAGYEWTWLRPTATLTLSQAMAGALTRGTFVTETSITQTTTGAVATFVSNDGSNMTIYGVNGTADASSTWYPTDDGSDVTNAWTPTEIADTSKFDMPDDFGRLHGDFHYAANDYRNSIPGVPLASIYARRAVGIQYSAPALVATRFKESDGSTGQRQEVLFWPSPDALWTLTYEYEAYSGALSDSSPYPLGGMKLAELYIESCLAVAETRSLEEVGLHTQQYGALLIDAIARDKRGGPQNFGQMGNFDYQKDDYDSNRFRRGYGSANYPISYNGTDL
jgi:hypothetical protein